LGRIRFGCELALQFAQDFPLVIAEHNAPSDEGRESTAPPDAYRITIHRETIELPDGEESCGQR
jgi:hypothetical protein